jgi:hypothetical protein
MAGTGASATSILGATNGRFEAHNGHSLQPTTMAVHAPYRTVTQGLQNLINRIPLTIDTQLTTGAIRVLFWGAIAMAVTSGVGAVFGTIV